MRRAAARPDRSVVFRCSFTRLLLALAVLSVLALAVSLLLLPPSTPAPAAPPRPLSAADAAAWRARRRSGGVTVAGEEAAQAYSRLQRQARDEAAVRRAAAAAQAAAAAAQGVSAVAAEAPAALRGAAGPAGRSMSEQVTTPSHFFAASAASAAVAAPLTSEREARDPSHGRGLRHRVLLLDSVLAAPLATGTRAGVATAEAFARAALALGNAMRELLSAGNESFSRAVAAARTVPAPLQPAALQNEWGHPAADVVEAENGCAGPGGRTVDLTLARSGPRVWVGPLPTCRHAFTCLPSVVIAGVQKAGTTALFGYLLHHPFFLPAAKKELHFFDRNLQRGLPWLLRLMPALPASPFPERILGGPAPSSKPQSPLLAAMAAEAAAAAFSSAAEAEQANWEAYVASHVTGEATPSYVLGIGTAARLAETLPHARVVVILRDPVDRAFSEYNMKLRRVETQVMTTAAGRAKPGANAAGIRAVFDAVHACFARGAAPLGALAARAAEVAGGEALRKAQRRALQAMAAWVVRARNDDAAGEGNVSGPPTSPIAPFEIRDLLRVTGGSATGGGEGEDKDSFGDDTDAEADDDTKDAGSAGDGGGDEDWGSGGDDVDSAIADAADRIGLPPLSQELHAFAAFAPLRASLYSPVDARGAPRGSDDVVLRLLAEAWHTGFVEHVRGLGPALRRGRSRRRARRRGAADPAVAVAAAALRAVEALWNTYGRNVTALCLAHDVLMDPGLGALQRLGRRAVAEAQQCMLDTGRPDAALPGSATALFAAGLGWRARVAESGFGASAADIGAWAAAGVGRVGAALASISSSLVRLGGADGARSDAHGNRVGKGEGEGEGEREGEEGSKSASVPAHAPVAAALPSARDLRRSIGLLVSRASTLASGTGSGWVGAAFPEAMDLLVRAATQAALPALRGVRALAREEATADQSESEESLRGKRGELWVAERAARKTPAGAAAAGAGETVGARLLVEDEDGDDERTGPAAAAARAELRAQRVGAFEAAVLRCLSDPAVLGRQAPRYESLAPLADVVASEAAALSRCTSEGLSPAFARQLLIEEAEAAMRPAGSAATPPFAELEPRHPLVSSPEPMAAGAASAAPVSLLNDGQAGVTECWPQGSSSNIAVDFLYRGIYARQLARLYAAVGRERVLVLSDTELRHTPQLAVDTLCDFLALPRIDVAAASARRGEGVARALEAAFPQFGRTGWRLDGDYAPMDAALRAQLAAFFAPHNRALYSYLGRDFGWGT